MPAALIGALLGVLAGVGLLLALPRLMRAWPKGSRIRMSSRPSRRREREMRRAWPDAVDALVSGVRAGLALPDAVAALGTTAPEALRPAFSAFAVEYRATGSMTVALDVLQARMTDAMGDRVVAALRLARDAGGSDLVPVLRGLGSMVREDARIRAEVEARQGWTIAAARMAVAAPWVTLALLCLRPEAARVFATPAGLAILVIAGGLCAFAYAVMMRIGRLPVDERTGS